jgi:hypothetical protein
MGPNAIKKLEPKSFLKTWMKLKSKEASWCWKTNFKKNNEINKKLQEDPKSNLNIL